jgi:hypothetical protein
LFNLSKNLPFLRLLNPIFAAKMRWFVAKLLIFGLFDVSVLRGMGKWFVGQTLKEERLLSNKTIVAT